MRASPEKLNLPIKNLEPPRRGVARKWVQVFTYDRFIHDLRQVKRDMGIRGFNLADAWTTAVVCKRYPGLQLLRPIAAVGTVIPRVVGPHTVCWCWEGFPKERSDRLLERDEERRPALRIIRMDGGWSPSYAFLGQQDA
jgi:hypothetical protein